MAHPDGESQQSLSYERVCTWLRQYLATLLDCPLETITLHTTFASYGVRPSKVIRALGTWLERNLPPTLLYDYPTIAQVAAHLTGQNGATEQAPGLTDGEQTAATIQEPIAIIGIGCRLPGGATSPTAFWHLLTAGRDAITDVPADRWDADALYDPDPATMGKTYARWGGFLDDIDQFDSSFFGISPREAAWMDPQQRILLETAWEALEDAGIPATQQAGSLTGVFIGAIFSDYGQAQLQQFATMMTYAGTGSLMSILANRLSYAFDFHGPSIVMDAACASSLASVHAACQSLRTGEATLALAGGVQLNLLPHLHIAFARGKLLAPDGRCKTFDARANGYVRSEGAGLVVLKRLSQAVADGDRVYAVIRGSTVQQDGLTNGIMAPNRHAQEALLRTAYRCAGVVPEQVAYVEAHGTGTFLGDPIEATALGTVLGASRAADAPCLVGSVKTNIGHLEGAAGVASLIKVALMLHHRELVPSLHFAEPNPHIPFEDLRLQVVQAHCPWPDGGRPRIAGVSSFGFGGTIAHMVLAEAPEPPGEPRPAQLAPALLPLSARSPQALHDLAQAYVDLLVAEDAPALPDICYTASVRRDHHLHRLAVVGATPAALLDQVRAFRDGQMIQGASRGAITLDHLPRLVFVFPGQGSQWVGMGRQLLQTEPVFRAAIAQCEAAFEPYVDWSLLEQLTADGAASRLTDIGVIQPTLFALQVSLAALWRSWGIVPAAVVGHSMGEVAAAYVAGALTLDDAARVICRRSALLRRVRGQGAMAVVELPLEAAQQAIAGLTDKLSVAVCNSRRSSVLSGDPKALDVVLALLEAQSIFCRKVKVDVASHSPQMDPLLPELATALAGLAPRAGSIPIGSTVTTELTDGSGYDAAYWGRNLREPVWFADVVEALIAAGHTYFVELSPHPLLVSAVEEALRTADRDGRAVPSLRREQDEQMMLGAALGALYTGGYPVDWHRLYPQGGRCVDLPRYPWQHERYWLEGATTRHGLPQVQPQTGAAPSSGHPLLGQPFTPHDQPDNCYWTLHLAQGAPLLLEDHQVGDLPTLPAAATIDLTLAAAQTFWEGGALLEHCRLHQALTVPGATVLTVQLAIHRTRADLATFQLSSQVETPPAGATAWVLNASGQIRRASAPAELAPLDLAALAARCPEAVDAATHYAQMAARGLTYGVHYQGIESIWRSPTQALGRLHLPPETASTSGWALDPTLLDGGLQLLLALLPHVASAEAEATMYLPVGVGTLQQYAPLTGEVWGVAEVVPDAATDVAAQAERFTGDLRLCDGQGRILAQVQGVQLQRVGRGTAQTGRDALDQMCYARHWFPQPLAAAPAAGPTPAGRWLICADRKGVAQALVDRLAGAGAACTLLFADELLRKPIEDQFRHIEAVLSQQPTWTGIIHLWSLDTAETEAMPLDAVRQAQQVGCDTALTLVQALAQQHWRTPPRLWLVTRGAQAITAEHPTVAPVQALLWGLGQVIPYEHADFQCTRVDLGTSPALPDLDALVAELHAATAEDQIALRDGVRYVARIIHWAPAPAEAEPLPTGAPDLQPPTSTEGRLPFSLAIERPGILESMTLRSQTRRQPGPDEVEIEVIAAGLNFRDVLLALDALQGEQEHAPETVLPGMECAGRVVAVGANVTHLQPGQAVVALAQHSFCSFVTTPRALVAPMPAHLTFEEAATIPIAFLTAFYALYQVGRLAQGERVLIHAASGGVGLAAVQLAQLAGAEIFATAGSPEKRAFLRDLGVPHVFNSRSLDFADEIQQITNGAGVDVVLNSLGGDFIDRSLDLLRDYGRFIELGKRDYLQNRRLGLQPFLRNLSFALVDLWGMLLQRPERIQHLFTGLMPLFEQRQCQPLQHQTFAIAATYDVFRTMAQARHIGKLVLRIGASDQPYVTGADPYQPLGESAPTGTPAPVVRPDATYLITGGTGGLGLTVADWLVAAGARSLVLVSRSGASEAASQSVERLRAAGAAVEVYPANIAQADDVARLIAHIDAHLPPLRGVLHAAGLLDDALLVNMSHEQLHRVLAPKLDGAWNLHQQTRNHRLDLFVLFSSIVALLGSPGQANYAAANAFLDALAHARHAQGLPAVSINWGPWAEVGLAAMQANRGARLAGRGMESLTPEQGIQALQHILAHDAPQVGVVHLNVRQWQQSYPQTAATPLLADLRNLQPRQATATTAQSMRALLQAADPADARQLLEGHLGEQVAQVLRLRADQVDVQRPFSAMGFDSLMTLELRNRLEGSLELSLSSSLLWSYSTVVALTNHLAGRLNLAAPGNGATPAEPVSAAPATPQQTDLDNLSDEEIEALLQKELR